MRGESNRKMDIRSKIEMLSRQFGEGPPQEAARPIRRLIGAGFFSAALALIPVLYTLGRLNIGGDVLVPLGSDGLVKYLYHWISIADGEYFAINYYQYYALYRVLGAVGLNMYQMASVLSAALGVIAGMGIFKLCSLFRENESSYAYFLPITFYLFSPALLNAWHYNIIYAFSPWFVYFIFKVVKSKTIVVEDVIWINVILFFCSLDLPNPKYLFHLHLIAFLIFAGGLLLGLINLSFFKKHVGLAVVHVLLSSYIFLPTAYFVTQYSSEKYGVHVKSGSEEDQMPNYGTDTMERVFKLHQDNVFLNYKDADKYNRNVSAQLAACLFLFAIFLIPLLKSSRGDREYELLLFGLLLVYMLLAAGPNLPFGAVYEFAVTSVPLLAFLRTTAGAVFFLSLFYAVLLFILLARLKPSLKIRAAFVIAGAIIVASYPLFNGEYYKNFNAVNKYTDIAEHGFEIPAAYFRVKDALDSLKIDAKVFYPNSDLTYLNTRWGFFGPVIYNFIYKTCNIGINSVGKYPALHNIGFMFEDGSLIEAAKSVSMKGAVIAKDDFLVISRTSRSEFFPHFYTPRRFILSDDPAEALADGILGEDIPPRTAVLEEGEFKEADIAAWRAAPGPHLEFRKIDPTQYRVLIHGMKASSPIIFNENFNSGWRVFPVKRRSLVVDRSLLGGYKALDGNGGDQATPDEIDGFLRRGFLTSLGDGKEKKVIHHKWKDGKATMDYTETFKLDFISKDFQDTIQNENLADASFHATWFKDPLPEAVHFLANGHANGWIIESARICRFSPESCSWNPDGTVDLEMIVQFWPQQIYQVCLSLSIATLAACLLFSAGAFLKKLLMSKERPLLACE
jgi:hypothetical protein